MLLEAAEDGASHPLAQAATALQLLWVAAEPAPVEGDAATCSVSLEREETLCALCSGLGAMLEHLSATLDSQTSEQQAAGGTALRTGGGFSHVQTVCSVALSLAKVGCRGGRTQRVRAHVFVYARAASAAPPPSLP